MYQYINGNLAISVNDWKEAGLTYKQFNHDSHDGLLEIAHRGINGNTLIWVNSIKRPDRMRAIEAALGKACPEQSDIYEVSVNAEAREYFSKYSKPDGTKLDAATIERLVMKASLFDAMRHGMERQQAARARAGKKLNKSEWLKTMLDWQIQQCLDKDGVAYGILKPYTNTRGLERAFKAYLYKSYPALLNGNIGSDNARKVSRNVENLILALWRTNDKPFVHRVWELYMQFINGWLEVYDMETGVAFDCLETDSDGNRIYTELSEATIWNYLKNVVNTTAVYADRNGHFDYQNTLRPKHHRKVGNYSLSKISMDDVALSRKAKVAGKDVWVYKYIAVDVVSGYYFRPAYIIGKPNERTVYESMRNVFCELWSLGLPMPAELEVEHHLMSDIPWLQDAFRFVRFCESPTEKRAEHNIRSLKWGTAKDMGHTRGRWYAKHEAYRAVRNKVEGDYVEPAYDPMQIIADDLADIERHNNELHPRQKTYPGLTRRDVLTKQANPDLKSIDMAYLMQFIGNVTETSIRNNDWCMVDNTGFELKDFGSLNRLKPNNYRVTAYWLPSDDESVETVYLYQDGVYIGEAENREKYAYNECEAERTESDAEAMLHQQKRVAKFDKFVKERRAELPKVGHMDAELTKAIDATPLEVVPEQNEQPKGYEEDEWNAEDYAALAISRL
ncbi:MAG: hypothetical protein MJZ90_03590 [Bacteroidales bacterium]|nr:hypothetical protein [Bacteroidales bacterium]